MFLPDDIKILLSECGLCGYDIIPHTKIQPYLNEKQMLMTKWVKSIICAAFPYFTGFNDGNISYYARGKDYHTVLRHRLEPISTKLSEHYKDEAFKIYIDSSVLPEVTCARISGLAFTGRNGLAICPPYGSFIFLGFIACSISFASTNSDAGYCGDICTESGGKDWMCHKSCPTGALDGNMGGLCISAITQKKGELSVNEKSLIRNSTTIWGCDLCQLCCPYNKNPKTTDIKEFYDSINNLNLSMLKDMTRKTFKKAFPDRAFTYKGPEILRRNLKI